MWRNLQLRQKRLVDCVLVRTAYEYDRKVYYAECGISKMCILQNFACGNSLRNKVYFAELKLRKMFLLLSYVN